MESLSGATKKREPAFDRDGGECGFLVCLWGSSLVFMFCDRVLFTNGYFIYPVRRRAERAEADQERGTQRYRSVDR